MTGISVSTRLAAGGAFFCAFFAVVPAVAQIEPPQVPLDVTACIYTCTTDGTITNTILQPITVTNDPSGFGARITGQVRTDFTGNLSISGIPTQPQDFPAGIWFSGESPVTVSLSTSYIANIDESIGNATLATANPSFSFNILSKDVQSIDVHIQDGQAQDAVTGQYYDYNLSSIDPKAITNDSVLLSGHYHSDEGDAIIFGKLTGSATLLSGTVHSVLGYNHVDYISPFAVQTQVTAQETTRLDENGLITPKISVTDGIDMNGSRVTNLGAGVAATDAVNKGQLDAEAGTRAAADQALATAIDTEAGTRAAADTQLATAINTEATTRATADTALATDLTNETSARMAADAGLASRLDGISGRVDELDSRIDKVDRRAMSGTAVAVAMGGATFLPDTHFNLTANVATYGGSQAGAVQVGALVSRHIAVNAGVASGFGRGGRTAGRAGFTVGW